ncbi:CGNR zinc finger domain-containing protein [Intrasporangium sp.]|uniref:CGNR zinc finger domain-containing protein n=1 Tax=Intrasporangium sp. TaxID=1925024 RepID=UPI00293A315D|nr:ABATE domain-containing protein [Intrasporangium sp.]MDV3222608.1 ABATE domain-containing protein [Intrasporangium sp.]
MPDVELVGNALCLDFTNTVNARPNASRDWLATPEQARTWADAVGRETTAERIDASALAAARTLREQLHDIFGALATGAKPAPEDLDALVRAHAAAVGRARLLRSEAGSYRLDWPDDGTLTPVIDAVSNSAIELLAHGPLHRLGRCPSCGWLFVDTSKNGRRRWCSMATCGARDKARRHYRAQQAERQPAP